MTSQRAQQPRAFRAVSEALYPALADDPFYQTLENQVRDPVMPKDAMLAYYDYSIYEAQQYGKIGLLGDTARGVSVWSVPLDDQSAQAKAQQKKKFIQQDMGDTCLATYEEICANMARNARPITSHEDWYLSILGILPRYQGQGLGAGLIRPILNLADAAGVSTFLETFTPRNMSFYQRLGYTTAGTFHEPVSKSRYWLMRRPPGQT